MNRASALAAISNPLRSSRDLHPGLWYLVRGNMELLVDQSTKIKGVFKRDNSPQTCKNCNVDVSHTVF